MTPEVRALLEGSESPETPSSPVSHPAVSSSPLTHNPFKKLRTQLDRRGFTHPLLSKESERNYMSNNTTAPADEPRRNRRAAPPPAPPEVPQEERRSPTTVEQHLPFTPDEVRLARYTRKAFAVGKLVVGTAIIVGAASYIAKTALHWKGVVRGPKVG